MPKIVHECLTLNHSVAVSFFDFVPCKCLTLARCRTTVIISTCELTTHVFKAWHAAVAFLFCTELNLCSSFIDPQYLLGMCSCALAPIQSTEHTLQAAKSTFDDAPSVAVDCVELCLTGCQVSIITVRY